MSLDPDLDEVASNWNREKRLRVATIMEKWSKLLKASAGFFDGSISFQFPPQVKSVATTPAKLSDSPSATIAPQKQKKLRSLLAKKAGHEIRIEGVIRRLLDTNIEEEQLVTDEIKDAVRAIFPHLTFTDGDLNKLISEAKATAKQSKLNSRRRNRKPGWININMSGFFVDQMRKVAAIRGTTFRTFCELALRGELFNECKKLGVEFSELRTLTPGEIGKLLNRTKAMHCLPINFYPEKN